MKSNSRKRGVPVPQAERQIWDQFLNDQELLERLRVTPQELNALADCVLLGTLKSKQDMLFILRQIRMATDPSAEKTTLSPGPALRPGDKREYSAKDFSALADHRYAASVRSTPEPASVAANARSRVIGKFGVLFWAIALITALTWNIVSGLSSWRQHFLAKAHQPTAPDVRHTSQREE